MLPFLTVLTTLVLTCQGAPQEDLITSLPGADFTIPFAQYSGYLTGAPGKMLHYWFTESQRDPASDAIILWMNGGPGCSSLDGFLAELGPFKVDSEGVNIMQNPYSWNLNASVLFLEAPACVGFSYDVNNDCESDDDLTSLSNYMALQDFFANKFPEYRNNEFYVTGESYCGIYVPTLSQRIVEGLTEFSLNFAGYAIGNGMLSYETNDNSVYFMAYHYGILGKTQWDKLVAACCEDGKESKDTCNFHNPTGVTCLFQVVAAQSVVYSGDFNYYGIYNECKQGDGNKVSNNRTTTKLGRQDADLDNLFREVKKKAGILNNKRSKAYGDPPCVDTRPMKNWLNSPAVREALHIPAEVQEWELCSDEVLQLYGRQYFEMSSQINYLLEHNVKGLVYNGDWDLACNHLGNKWFIHSLGLTEIEKYREWYYDGQVAGFVNRYPNLDFVQVKGSGHMVPEDTPGASLKMIYDWIEGRPY